MEKVLFIYLRAVGQTDLDVSLYISKARFVSIKFLTIFRLGLQGAVAGLRLGQINLQAVGDPVIRVYFMDGFNYCSIIKCVFFKISSVNNWYQ